MIKCEQERLRRLKSAPAHLPQFSPQIHYARMKAIYWAIQPVTSNSVLPFARRCRHAKACGARKSDVVT